MKVKIELNGKVIELERSTHVEDQRRDATRVVTWQSDQYKIKITECWDEITSTLFGDEPDAYQDHLSNVLFSALEDINEVCHYLE